MIISRIFTSICERGRAWHRCPIVPVLMFGLSGCSDSAATTKAESVYPVHGKVLLADKKPLTSGRMYFMPVKGSTHAAMGNIGPDGTFSLTTANAGEGAEPGEYRIRIEPLEESLPKARPGARTVSRASYPFPIKYNDEDSSGLTATVKPEPNTLEPFRLK